MYTPSLFYFSPPPPPQVVTCSSASAALSPAVPPTKLPPGCKHLLYYIFAFIAACDVKRLADCVDKVVAKCNGHERSSRSYWGLLHQATGYCCRAHIIITSVQISTFCILLSWCKESAIPSNAVSGFDIMPIRERGRADLEAQKGGS